MPCFKVIIFQLFCRDYPEFEFELHLFNQPSHLTLQTMLCKTYLDTTDVHHHHYFLDMKPFGHTKHSCNIITYICGVPTPLIYVPNFTNYDFNFMLLPDIMAYKEKIPKNNGHCTVWK